MADRLTQLQHFATRLQALGNAANRQEADQLTSRAVALLEDCLRKTKVPLVRQVVCKTVNEWSAIGKIRSSTSTLQSTALLEAAQVIDEQQSRLLCSSPLWSEGETTNVELPQQQGQIHSVHSISGALTESQSRDSSAVEEQSVTFSPATVLDTILFDAPDDINETIHAARMVMKVATHHEAGLRCDGGVARAGIHASATSSAAIDEPNTSARQDEVASMVESIRPFIATCMRQIESKRPNAAEDTAAVVPPRAGRTDRMAVRVAVCSCLLYRAIRFATESSAVSGNDGLTGVAKSGKPTVRGVCGSTADRLHELCHGILDLMHCMHQHAAMASCKAIKSGLVSSFVRWSILTAMEAIAGIMNAWQRWERLLSSRDSTARPKDTSLRSGVNSGICSSPSSPDGGGMSPRGNLAHKDALSQSLSQDWSPVSFHGLGHGRSTSPIITKGRLQRPPVSGMIGSSGAQYEDLERRTKRGGRSSPAADEPLVKLRARATSMTQACLAAIKKSDGDLVLHMTWLCHTLRLRDASRPAIADPAQDEPSASGTCMSDNGSIVNSEPLDSILSSPRNAQFRRDLLSSVPNAVERLYRDAQEQLQLLNSRDRSSRPRASLQSSSQQHRPQLRSQLFLTQLVIARVAVLRRAEESKSRMVNAAAAPADKGQNLGCVDTPVTVPDDLYVFALQYSAAAYCYRTRPMDFVASPCYASNVRQLERPASKLEHSGVVQVASLPSHTPEHQQQLPERDALLVEVKRLKLALKKSNLRVLAAEQSAPLSTEDIPPDRGQVGQKKASCPHEAAIAPRCRMLSTDKGVAGAAIAPSASLRAESKAPTRTPRSCQPGSSRRSMGRKHLHASQVVPTQQTVGSPYVIPESVMSGVAAPDSPTILDCVMAQFQTPASGSRKLKAGSSLCSRGSQNASQMHGRGMQGESLEASRLAGASSASIASSSPGFEGSIMHRTEDESMLLDLDLDYDPGPPEAREAADGCGPRQDRREPRLSRNCDRQSDPVHVPPDAGAVRAPRLKATRNASHSQSPRAMQLAQDEIEDASPVAAVSPAAVRRVTEGSKRPTLSPLAQSLLVYAERSAKKPAKKVRRKQAGAAATKQRRRQAKGRGRSEASSSTKGFGAETRNKKQLKLFNVQSSKSGSVDGGTTKVGMVRGRNGDQVDELALFTSGTGQSKLRMGV